MVKVRQTTEENKRNPKNTTERQAARRQKLKGDNKKYKEYLEKQRILVARQKALFKDEEKSK